MKKLICDFLTKNHYPQEAAEAVLGAYEVLKDNPTFMTFLERFYVDTELNLDLEGSPLDLLCREVGVNFYTAKLLFYICLTEELREKYREAGFPEHMYDTAIEDMYTKAKECVDVYGIWGIFSPGWFYSIFHLRVFGMGRLFYNTGEYKGEDMTIGGRTVTQGDLYISIHIPSSGKPFDKASRLASYEMAYYFFKDAFEGKEPLFRCGTWLLNPANRELLGEKSNIVSFMDDFRLVATYDNPTNSSLWRVFGAAHELPPEKLPRDTSLRRAYADHLARGNTFDGGIGFFVFDPVNKVTLK